MRNGERQHRGMGGFTFVWTLATVALASLGLATIGPLWSESVKREREADLLRIGALYARAIASYRDKTPGTVKAYPTSLASLLDDTRILGTYRHLRQVYPDPLAPHRAWGLVAAPDGGIAGVYSQSAERPFREGSIDLGDIELRGAAKYSDWKFLPRANDR